MTVGLLHHKFKLTKKLIIPFIAVLLSYALFFSIKKGNISFSLTESETSEVKINTQYKFLSPYSGNDRTPQTKVNAFEKELIKIDEIYKDIDVSIYYRDLNNGPWTAYNPLSIFDGASLLKVPILISYLKSAEQNSDLLKTKIFYEKELEKIENQDKNFNNVIKVGETYTIEYLLEEMIYKSDNGALALLEIAAQELKLYPTIEETHRLLGLKNNGDLILIDEYSGIFRILYNSEYLNNEMSEKALSILSKSEYHNGLTKYAPPDLQISHKYGIRYYENDKTQQLHDCGIIYTSNPYILCVMTIGENIEIQEKIISKIAQKSFEIFK